MATLVCGEPGHHGRSGRRKAGGQQKPESRSTGPSLGVRGSQSPSITDGSLQSPQTVTLLLRAAGIGSDELKTSGSWGPFTVTQTPRQQVSFLSQNL